MANQDISTLNGPNKCSTINHIELPDERVAAYDLERKRVEKLRPMQTVMDSGGTTYGQCPPHSRPRPRTTYMRGNLQRAHGGSPPMLASHPCGTICLASPKWTFISRNKNVQDDPERTGNRVPADLQYLFSGIPHDGFRKTSGTK